MTLDVENEAGAPAMADLDPGFPEGSGAPSAAYVYGCITHVPLLFEYPPFVKTICLGEAQAPGRLNLRDLAPHWEPYHGLIGGSAGTFALKNLVLATQPDVRRVGICQYRKVMTRGPIGMPFPETPGSTNRIMDVATRNDLTADRLADVMLGGDHDFLIKPSRFLRDGTSYDYLYQYASSHHVEDLLRFTAMAVELGVLHGSEVADFFREHAFVMGGVELGVYPGPFWLAAVTALETVTWHCLHRYETRREGLQARLWSYCMERLGSFLIVRHLGGDHAALEARTGHLTLVTDDGAYVPGV